MNLPGLWLMLALLPKSITSKDLNCSATTTSSGTIYKVPDFGKPKCVSHWMDVDDHILADSDGKNDSLVLSSNITTLHTYDCYNAVIYVRDCYPLRSLNKKVTCVANCSERARVSVTPGKTEGTRNHWVIPMICIIFAILLVIGRICYCRCQHHNQGRL